VLLAPEIFDPSVKMNVLVGYLFLSSKNVCSCGVVDFRGLRRVVSIKLDTSDQDKGRTKFYLIVVNSDGFAHNW